MALASPSDAAAFRRRAPERPADPGDLTDLAFRIRPTAAAHERTLPVPGPFAAVLAVLTRGTVVSLDGPPGAGVTSLAFGLAAAATRAGEWVALVDPTETFGVEAARDCGIDLERCVVARRIPDARWPAVVAALLDGATCVVTSVPPHLRTTDARRLIAKARERDTALVVVGPWPAEAAWRIRAHTTDWSGFDADVAFLPERRTLTAHVEGRGTAPRRASISLQGSV